MNILILGYGKMGKQLEKYLLANGHTVCGIIDNVSEREKYSGTPDAAIEFSMPDAAVSNLLWCFEKNIPVVTGTTGWLEKLPMVSEKCLELNGAFLWGSNFSVGMNVFFILNQHLTKMMNLFEQYRPSVTETHHVHKLDRPSGTAITLASDMIRIAGNIDTWAMDIPNPAKGELPVYVFREGEINGIHEVAFTSPQDIISIRHEALTREGFAMGALMAARWISKKKGVFSFQQCFHEIVNNQNI